MGNIKGAILTLGIFFVLLNSIDDVRTQNNKSFKTVPKNKNGKDETKDGNKNGNVAPSAISINEATLGKENESNENIVLAKQETIKEEAVISKDNDKIVDIAKDSTKEINEEKKKESFIEGENKNEEKANIITKEQIQGENGLLNDIIVIKVGDANPEDVVEALKKKMEEKESEINYIEQQSIDMDDISTKKEPVQESNLYFLQVLAFISSIFMQLTSIPTVFKILKKKSTGELDGLAYVMLLYSSFLWLVYGMLIENTAVILPNFSGVTLGLIYTASYHKYCKSMWLKQKLYSYYKICGLVSFLLYIFIYFMTFEQYVLSAGLLASVSSVINFGAPLSSVREVIKKRSTESMPLEMTLGSLTCSFLWLLYGVTLKDAFIIIPNLGGFLLGLMQIFLIILYSNKEPLQFIPDESCFKEHKDSYRPGGDFYREGNEEFDNKVSDVSTTVHEPFFDFTYDETSPLTSDTNFILKQNIEKNEKVLKNPINVEEDTVLNF